MYKNETAKIIGCDPYFKDYNVRFKDNTEDWILSKYLSSPHPKKRS